MRGGYLMSSSTRLLDSRRKKELYRLLRATPPQRIANPRRPLGRPKRQFVKEHVMHTDSAWEMKLRLGD